MRHYRGPIFLPQVAHAIGSSDPRTAPNLPSSPATATTAASPTETGITLWNWRPTIAGTPRSRTSYETPHQVRGRLSSTAWGSTISSRAASLPTPPGWRFRLWRKAWPAGQRASVWAINRRLPRHAPGGFSPVMDDIGTPFSASEDLRAAVRSHILSSSRGARRRFGTSVSRMK